jgi:DNA-binding transcriptional MerR regulator/effector-binding domain-containing protein
MNASVPIGEFSRLTHLTVKTLRHYHQQGLLVPYAVDDQSGYRRYSIDQVSAALLIGRLRALDMPLADVRRVVDCADSRERDAVIAEHLGRMERELDRTRAIVTSLRDLLSRSAPLEIGRQLIPDLNVVAVTERVDREDIGAWCQSTFTALYADLVAARAAPTGPGGALYDERFFTEAVGEVTAYVPVGEPPSNNPQRRTTMIPGGPYAVAMHTGPFVDFDKTYAALGSYVAAYQTSVPGPIREIYLISPPETTNEADFRTQVCWPVAA